MRVGREPVFVLVFVFVLYMFNEDDDFVLLLEGLEGMGEAVAGGEVHPGGGFVEEEDGGVAVELPGECDALPLTHAEVLAAVEHAAERGVIASGELLDEGVGTGEAGSVLDCWVVEVLRC